MLTFSQARPGDIGQIEAFYAQCGYGGKVNQNDLVFTACYDGVLVGTVRLCLMNDFLVLRGMQVAASFQRQGVGTRLLRECLGQIDRVCYCIPYRHLEAFYGQIGFELAMPNDVPHQLRDRLNTYLAQGLDGVLMCRVYRKPQIEGNAIEHSKG